MTETSGEKKQNWFVRLWNYYSTYEKTWLISICTIGILVGIFFPEDSGSRVWLRVVEIIAIVGGCSCELLLSKQSKWAFIVSFCLYDTTQTIVYFANGYYISALFEIIFWIPILFISFYFWDKKTDSKNKLLTSVKEVNYKRDLLIFLGLLALSAGVGFLFTRIDIIANGMSDYWYLDALANAFSVCNGLFLLMRFKEQWAPWLGVAIVEAVMWILSGQFIMLILSLGYIMNCIYGFIQWNKYIKTHPKCKNETFFGKPLDYDANAEIVTNENLDKFHEYVANVENLTPENADILTNDEGNARKDGDESDDAKVSESDIRDESEGDAHKDGDKE